MSATFKMADYPGDPEAASAAASRYAAANRGEPVAVEVATYRRRWQFWKPRIVGSRFVIIGVGPDQFYRWTAP